MRTAPVLVSIITLAATLLPAQAPPARRANSTLADFSSALEELCAGVSPAVVEIEVRSRTLVQSGDGSNAGFFAKRSGNGSGVIVDSTGFIVTNAHVVAGARDIDVSVAEMRSGAVRDAHKHFPATVIGIDKETDLAVLKIEATGLPTLSFRDSDKLRQGQLVLALGSPLGLENTLTVGHVSATARQLKPEKPLFYVQTDAPINPGNSGGPLIDIDGKIAGINTLIISQSGGSEGIGFAIPANLARRVYEQLRKDGHITRGTISVVAQDINPLMAQALGINRHPGVILSDVLPGGPAARAGLEPNDIVLTLGGQPVTEARQVQEAVLNGVVGDKLTLGIVRGAEMLQRTVTIGARPQAPLALEDLVNLESNLVRELGILALSLDEKLLPSMPDTRGKAGVVVAAIPAEFAALNPGLQAGDIIYSLNTSVVRSLEELRTALRSVKPGDPIAMLTEHDSTLGYVSFTLE